MQVVERDFIVFQEQFEFLRREVGKVFVGHPDIVTQILICLFCRGHVLIEGLPGLGKTSLVKTLSDVLGLGFSRIQCTPDLMPSDILGTNLLVEDALGKQTVQFQKGPIFANVVLTDEVNRATPKTQSAFLEAMQENEVTALGVTYRLEDPFFLLATQNPIEMEGTFPLPEAQLDRFFFKLRIDAPDLEELSRIVDLTTGEQAPRVEPTADRDLVGKMSSLVRRVKIAENVKRYALRMVLATHAESGEAPEAIRRHVKYGASPRGAQSMILAGKARALSRGRFNVSLEDLRAMAMPALSHRIILNFQGEVEGMTTEGIVQELLARL